MTNITLENLQEASFRGASFLYKSGTKEFGRKFQSHEYPGRKERFVEDLGELDDKFSITAIITGPNYTQKRDSLEKALRQPGPGQLIHPFYGPIQVSVTGISVDEDLTRLNVATYELSFEKTGTEDKFPQDVVASQPALLNSAQSVSSLIQTYIGTNYFVSPRYPNNYEDAVNHITDISEKFENILAVRTLTGDISSFSNRISNFKEKLYTYINSPETLAQELVGLFTDMQSLSSDADIQYSLNQNFNGYGDDQLLLEEKTLGRIERAKNRRVLNDSLNALALVNSYEATVNSSYFSIEELNTTRNELETFYQSVVVRNKIDLPVLNELSQARVYTRDFFKEQEAQAFRVNTISTNKIPTSILAYKYYGNTDLTENLIELNNITYNPSVEGEVKLYTR